MASQKVIREESIPVISGIYNNVSSHITDTNITPLKQHLKTVNIMLGVCISDRTLT